MALEMSIENTSIQVRLDSSALILELLVYLVRNVKIYSISKSKSLFQRSRLSVHLSVRTSVTKFFFRLNRLEITP